MKGALTFLLIGLIFLTACAQQPPADLDVDATEEAPPLIAPELTGEPEVTEEYDLEKREIKTTRFGKKYVVDPSNIRGGGPGKGGIGVNKGIPALAENNINFVSVATADTFIQDNELVLAFHHKDVKKVYPLQIMVWHEIANDIVAGDPIAITYCPLCGSGIAFDRTIEIDGEKKVTRFGTSGKLFNSNLVMYDEDTDTYWTQIDGFAIIGDLTGQQLKQFPIDTVTWRDYKAAHPDAEVLSQETSIPRDYGRDPYGSYYEDSFLFFPVENEDERIHPKTPILGININGVFKAYREDQVKEEKVIEDTVNDVTIKLEADDVGIITITNVDTGEIIQRERDFWFAWYAFHPETGLYEG